MTALLRICAALIGLRGLVNLAKPLGAGSTMVVLGQRLPISSPLGPIVGVYMIVCAYGLWRKRPFALPMGIAYAIFATLNVILFYVFQGLPEGFNALGYAGFAVVALVVPWSAVVLLRRELGAR